RIIIGGNIGNINNAKIFYSVSENCNPFNLADYSGFLYDLVKKLSSQGNCLFPKPSDLKYWENKAHMQNQFNSYDINHPKTIILKRDYKITDIDKLKYPILLKEIHSAGSRGITKIENQNELLKSLDIIWNKGHSSVLIQKLINMRRDLRVVVLNDKVISFYWRVNPTKEWRPTATSFGNKTEFGNFPKKWKKLFINYLKKMNLTTGAYDVAWENDNTENTPLILEVSPFYQLNPPLPKKFSSLSYKQYKKKLFSKESYYKKYVDIVFENRFEITKNYLSNIKNKN
ncbi:hypothetical protein N8298_01475, partial [Flavobacteriaceae bacterium]|nr:hypothetical protein [Flavobacteriaceae bacterium]